MKILRSFLCLAAVPFCGPARAESVQQTPPLDAVTRIEQGYWNLTRRENNLPQESAFSGAEIVRCKNILDPAPAYTALLECSVKVSYGMADGSIRHVATNTNYGSRSDGVWAPVVISNVAPQIEAHDIR